MWPYWLLFSVVVWMALHYERVIVLDSKLHSRWSFGWGVSFILLSLTIGLRHEVGGDWPTYQMMLDRSVGNTLGNVELFVDPAYDSLNWFGANLWGGIYFVNLTCALLFTWGLTSLCRMQPRPWLAMLVAVPYLITVVAMGYTRQGVAIGLAMLGISALARGNILRFLCWVALAVAFHKSAIILVPLALFSRSRYRLLMIVGVLAATALLFVLMVQESVEFLAHGYLASEYQSSGAPIRIAMNALPAALFLFYRKRFSLGESENQFWIWVSLGALLFVVLLFASPSSTAVDRLALYWIPLQLFVWSRLPDAMGRSPAAVRRWIRMVVVYCFAVHFVWLFYAENSKSWIPYRFYLWEWFWN